MVCLSNDSLVQWLRWRSHNVETSQVSGEGNSSVCCTVAYTSTRTQFGPFSFFIVLFLLLFIFVCIDCLYGEIKIYILLNADAGVWRSGGHVGSSLHRVRGQHQR